MSQRRPSVCPLNIFWISSSSPQREQQHGLRANNIIDDDITFGLKQHYKPPRGTRHDGFIQDDAKALE